MGFLIFADYLLGCSVLGCSVVLGVVVLGSVVGCEAEPGVVVVVVVELVSEEVPFGEVVFLWCLCFFVVVVLWSDAVPVWSVVAEDSLPLMAPALWSVVLGVVALVSGALDGAVAELPVVLCPLC